MPFSDDDNLLNGTNMFLDDFYGYDFFKSNVFIGSNKNIDIPNHNIDILNNNNILNNITINYNSNNINLNNFSKNIIDHTNDIISDVDNTSSKTNNNVDNHIDKIYINNIINNNNIIDIHNNNNINNNIHSQIINNNNSVNNNKINNKLNISNNNMRLRNISTDQSDSKVHFQRLCKSLADNNSVISTNDNNNNVNNADIVVNNNSNSNNSSINAATFYSDKDYNNERDTVMISTTTDTTMAAATNYNNTADDDFFLVDNSDNYKIDPNNIMGQVGAILVIIMIIFGSTGNFLVLMVVTRCPTLKKSYNTFIASLSATDLLFNLAIMPFYADSFYHRRWRFSTALCMFHAFFGTVLIMCSSLHVALIAINRYFLVVHMSFYPKVSKVRILVLQIIIVWLISTASVIPGAVGWHAVVRYTDQISRCTYVRSESKESLDIVFSMGFVLPSFVVFICYGLIWYKSKGSRKRLRSYKNPSQGESEASLIEKLISKFEFSYRVHHRQRHHGCHLHRCQHHDNIQNAVNQTSIYGKRHSLPPSLSPTKLNLEVKFKEMAEIKDDAKKNSLITDLSDHSAKPSPQTQITMPLATFYCGGPENSSPTVTFSNVFKNSPSLKSKLAIRLIKSFVRKVSEPDDLIVIKHSLSCPDLNFDLSCYQDDVCEITNVINEQLNNFMKSEFSTENPSDTKISYLSYDKTYHEMNLKKNDCLSECIEMNSIEDDSNCLNKCFSSGKASAELKVNVIYEKNANATSEKFSNLKSRVENNCHLKYADLKSHDDKYAAEKEAEKAVILELNPAKLEIEKVKNSFTKSDNFNSKSSFKNSIFQKKQANRIYALRNNESKNENNPKENINSFTEKPSVNNNKKACKKYMFQRHNSSVQQQQRRSSQKRRTRRKHSMKIIIIIFVAFVFTYLPFSVVNLADEKGELDRVWYMSTSLFFWAGSCLNPYIYGVLNEQFRSAYRSFIIKSVFPCLSEKFHK